MPPSSRSPSLREPGPRPPQGLTRRRRLERALLALAAIEVVFGATAFVTGVLAPELTVVSRLPVFLAYALSFLGVGLFLAAIGGEDEGARSLAVVLSLAATPFADAIISHTAPYSTWAEWSSFWLHLRLDAFLPFFLWSFAAAFPQNVVLGRPRRIAAAGKAVALAVGVALALLHLLAWLATTGSGRELVPESLLRTTRAGLYWPILFLLQIPALGLLVWQAFRSRSVHRRRVVWFVTALVAGMTPMLALTFGQSFSPAFARLFQERRTAVPLLAFYDLGLLSVPFTTAYAVTVKRVFDLRFALRKVVQYMMARVSFVLLSILPLALFGVFLVRQSHLPLDTLFGGPRGVLLLSWSGLGFLCLPQRKRWQLWLDRRFFREQCDAQQVLTELVQKTEDATSPEDLEHILKTQIDAALHVERIELLLYRPRLHCYASLGRQGPSLRDESPIVEMAAGSGGALQIDLESTTRVDTQVAEADQHWLSDHSFEVLIPVSGADGQLLALLGLGGKVSEQPFSRDDLRLLNAIARAAGLVLENRLLRDAKFWSSDSSPEPPGAESAHPPESTEWTGDPPALLCESCAAISLPDPKGRCGGCGGALGRIPLPRVINGKYRLTGWLGRGGMGVAYRAEDLALGREVAIKTLPTTSVQKAARLRREARAAARVIHPNLALIFGAETWRGQPLLVFELLEGGTLRERLSTGALEVQAALDLILPLADALRHLHAEGILHLDIKPSNIAFDRSGVPKLLDFGVARLVQEVIGGARSRAPSLDLAAATSASQLAGTPIYMSPEVLRGKAPDYGADVWSLCVVFYEAVAGRHPFAGAGSAEASLLRILKGSYARPIGVEESVAVPLERFFERAFAPSARRRPQNAVELEAQLREVVAEIRLSGLRGEPRPTAPDSRTRPRRPAAESDHPS